MAGIGLAHVVTLIAVAAVAQPSLGVDGIGAGVFLQLDRWGRTDVGCPSTIDRARRRRSDARRWGRRSPTMAAGCAAAVVLAMLPAGVGMRLVVGVAVFVSVGWAVGYVAGVEFVRTATRRAVIARPAPA